MSAAETDGEQISSYRAVSKSAVLAFCFGWASLAAFIAPGLVFLPVLGVLFSIVALVSFRRYPDELTGKGVAWVGTILSTSLLVGSIAMHVTIYLTEVPDGFDRISFHQLKPDKKMPEMPIPPLAAELHGRRIFVKGYVHPSVAQAGDVDSFILVPDMGTCCFGGTPKLTDMIEVRLTKGKKISYSYRKRSLAGTFQLDPTVTAADGSQGPCYKLVAEYVQ
ncbi:MAG TPA: DUF3299 domain-containing protein [Pirellulaceae bacterium]|nr:DUF3299 domain-containing protein [Pirellulaceae bacterium]